MALLEHNNFPFKNILSGGYNIKEDEPDIISEVKMADGSIKRNYGSMPKTSIKVKFPETSIISTTGNHRYEEFEVELNQCGEA